MQKGLGLTASAQTSIRLYRRRQDRVKILSIDARRRWLAMLAPEMGGVNPILGYI